MDTAVLQKHFRKCFGKLKLLTQAWPGLKFLLSAELVAVNSNEELNDQIDRFYVESSSFADEYFVGIFVHMDEKSDDPPENFKYDLRLQKFWFTDLIYPFLQIPGPRNYTCELELLMP